MLSGAALRNAPSEHREVRAEFSRKEVVGILRECDAGLTGKVEIELRGHATGEVES